ncbi:CBFD-NFYB-HMF domain-containing protein [Aphelenchoides bicaudatus]|nr:CBFD-NFYB-HMF domain-containing protein [Aphelenchoides bicaudatus]
MDTTTTKKRQAPLNDENTDPNRPVDTEEQREDGSLNGVLPLTRVKRLIKMASLTNTNVSAGAAKMIQLCAEEYLRAFVRATKVYAEQAGRKTIQPKDLTRVIKDDWAFALLEETLSNWPNDVEEPKIQVKVPSKPKNRDSASLFFFQQPDTLPEPSDTPMTNRDMVDNDDYTDLQSEFNDTAIFDQDHLVEFKKGDPTPKPTMEYLHITDSDPIQLSVPLSFEDADDESNYQNQLLSQNDSDDDELDVQRPHNSRFMNSRHIENEFDSGDSEEESEEDINSPSRSPDLFDEDDVGDMEDGFGV